MTSRKIVFPLAIAGILLACVASAHQPSKNNTSYPTHKNDHVVFRVKARKVLIAKPVKVGALADIRPMRSDIAWALGESFNSSRAGDAAVLQGRWTEAKRHYQDALDLVPDNPQALYGVARCAEAAGDTSTAVKYYRQEIYSHDPSRYGTVPGDGFQDNDVKHLMQFALLLDHVGQTAEAVFIYNHAAALFDYEGGDVQNGTQMVKVLLPELVAEPTQTEQVQYTLERLQALADTAIARGEISFGSDKEALAHMREAVKLYPDSAVTNYYLGEALLMKDSAGAKMAYQKAVQLGDDKTVLEAKERTTMCR